MKFSIDKIRTASITLVLVLTIAVALPFLPTINAQVPAGVPTIETFAGLTVSPSPVGVGQSVEFIMWINFLPASAGVEATTIVHGGWVGFTITVTKPDATTETFGPYESDPSGMWHISYKPATTGTYTVDFAFPGQLVVNTTWGGNNRHNYWYNAWFEALSRQRTFTV